jgi:hypothetical protein
MKKRLLCALLLITATCACCAQELPDAPQPKEKQKIESAFWTRQMIASTTASFLARAADTIQTCRYMKQKAIITVGTLSDGHGGIAFQGGTFVVPAFHEGWAPVNTCGGIIAWNTGGQAALFLGTELLHKTHHERLENLPNWISTAGSLFVVINNFRMHGRASLSGHFPQGVPISVVIK